MVPELSRIERMRSLKSSRRGRMLDHSSNFFIVSAPINYEDKSDCMSALMKKMEHTNANLRVARETALLAKEKANIFNSIPDKA